MERPVVRNQIANVGTLSTVASRRVVVVNSTFKLQSPFIESAFCAEPSPDLSEDIISNLMNKGELSGAVDTTGEIAKVQAQAQVELRKLFQNIGQQLFKRTQGMQFWRDGLFNLCQSYLNGSIKQEKFADKYSQLLTSTVELIKLEVLLMHISPIPTNPDGTHKVQDMKLPELLPLILSPTNIDGTHKVQDTGTQPDSDESSNDQHVRGSIIPSHAKP